MNDQASRQPLGAYRMPQWLAPPRRESRHLIVLAEELQSKREETMAVIRSHVRRRQLLLLAVVIGVAFGGMLLCVWGTIDAAVPAVLVGCYALSLIAAFALWTMGKVSLADLETRLRRDERALFEVVALLRETRASLAKAEDWSLLQEAEFRVWLSRYESGPIRLQYLR